MLSLLLKVSAKTCGNIAYKPITLDNANMQTKRKHVDSN